MKHRFMITHEIIKGNDMSIKIGDRVEILRKDIHHLKHRKRPWFGFVTNIDGSYIDVRPTHCKWIIELYPNEIKIEEN